MPDSLAVLEGDVSIEADAQSAATTEEVELGPAVRAALSTSVQVRGHPTRQTAKDCRCWIRGRKIDGNDLHGQP